MERWGRFNYQPGIPLGLNGTRITASPAHIELSKNAAKEGMILLKNEDGLLPLAKGTKLALFGHGTIDYVKGGGGSGDVTVSYVRSLYDGMKELGVPVYEELCDYYREDLKKQYAAGHVPGLTFEPELPQELLEGARAFSDTAIISICRFSGEGWDRCSPALKSADRLEDGEAKMLRLNAETFENSDFYLTEAEAAMVSAVTAAFPKVAVVLNVGGMVATDWIRDDASIGAALLALQGGMEGGLAAAELLFGMGNPSGKLIDTYAKSLDDYPSTYNFHESEDYVDYTDDIYVGYRYFLTIPGAAEKVIYPFGYGLSYTSFEVTPVKAYEEDGMITVAADICNTGAYAGKEVLQAYYSAPQGLLGKPSRQLAAFGKTRLLAPGESQRITLSFPVSDMASYDDLGKVCDAAWLLEAGDYQIYVGTSSVDLMPVYTCTLTGTVITEQLTHKIVPTSLKKRMLSDGSFEELPQLPPRDTDANVLPRQTVYEVDGYTPYGKPVERVKLWGSKEAPVIPFIDVAEGRASMDDFMAQLTDREVAELLGGQPNTGVANTYGFGNLPRYGVPNVMTEDGPAGVRIMPGCGICTTAFPCATLLASTWNPDIVEQVGIAGGLELKENNLGTWLTPAMNIHRSPLCGRNFEYYSEDPLIAGKMAAALVRGIQSNRVGSSVKHFAFNDKESNRKNSNSRVSERAARELYLKGFEICVKEADPWTIMTSYNIINDVRASENRELLTDILRGEWGFKGMVTTDWWTFGEHYKETLAGNDIKMGCGYPERLLMAMEKGAITRADMEACARRILEYIMKLD